MLAWHFHLSICPEIIPHPRPARNILPHRRKEQNVYRSRGAGAPFDEFFDSLP